MQDNQSAILIQKNYLFLVSKGRKNIEIKYLFVVDKIKNKIVKVIYYLRGNMVIDYSSKLTQGKLFFYHRNTIQGIKEEQFAL